MDARIPTLLSASAASAAGIDTIAGATATSAHDDSTFFQPNASATSITVRVSDSADAATQRLGVKYGTVGGLHEAGSDYLKSPAASSGRPLANSVTVTRRPT
jgi:hypothetical protein